MTDAEKKKQLKNKEGNLKSDARGHENSIKDIEAKITRLNNAKKELYGNQDTMKKSVKKKDQTICDDKYAWKGNWYSNDFKRDMHKMLNAEKDYLTTLNGDIDIINNKISYFEREKAKHQNILKKIWAEITSVGRQIENIGN